MRISSARSVLLPLFQRMATAIAGNHSSHITVSSITYFSSRYGRDDFDFEENKIPHFPVVLDSSGAPWREACYYIYKRITIDGIAGSTAHAIAQDLALYLRYLDEENLVFNYFPVIDSLKPVYRYRKYLRQLILAQNIRSSTASRRMSNVIGFYKRMNEEGIVKTPESLWASKSKWGMSDAKKNRSGQVGVGFKLRSGKDPNAIYDDGVLYPLSVDEQVALFEELRRLDNYEMSLIFYIAVFVGARIQTILTLRVNQFAKVREGKDHRVVAGEGTGIDTKFSKRLVLYFPDWLAGKIKTYIDSPRARDRRARCKLDLWNGVDYVFLSNRAAPYFYSKQDPSLRPTSGPKEGQAIRQFLYDRLLPRVKNSGNSFSFKFHDLRATYGLNLASRLLGLVEQGKLTLSQARSMLKEAMSHEKSETTDRYLRICRLKDLASIAQQEYEDHIVSCAKRALAESEL